MVKRVGNSEKAFVATAAVQSPAAPEAEERVSGRGDSFSLSSPKLPTIGMRHPKHFADARAAASQPAPRSGPVGENSVLKYYNLRFDRTPSKPWVVETGELVATVKGIPVRKTLEYDPEEKLAFGLCVIHEPELGYFSIEELESIELQWGLGIGYATVRSIIPRLHHSIAAK